MDQTGIPLAEAQTVRGEIVRMQELPIFEFPKIGGKRGDRITVDGAECITLIGEGLETGDYVSVVYLPESRYVLSIEETAAKSDVPKSDASEDETHSR